MSSEASKSASPPKARLTFRVGLVGHRPNRLKREDIPSLTARLGEVLSSVKQAVEDFPVTHPELFNSEPPRVRATSPLAEGTDRYFAREALRLGYELCCPLPFHKDEFENDFKPGNSLEPGMDSVADFNSILKAARNGNGLVMFELDGSRSDAAEAYGAAGRVVLNQSDILIVVWDGSDNNKPGGTYATLKDAIAFGVPVLWIDAQSPHSWQFLRNERDLPISSGDRCVPENTGTPDLKMVVDQILEPPKAVHTEEPHHKQRPDLRTNYFNERKRAVNLFFFWKIFRDLVGSFRFKIQNWHMRDFEEAVAEDWPKTAPGVAGWANTRLVSHYAWADKLADYYADAYRSSFVLCYILGAAAVGLALIPVMFGWSRENFPLGAGLCAGGEFFAVSLILILVVWGNKHRWHDRWMAYRLVAELVRQLRFLIPLGGGRPFPRQPQHLGGYGNPVDSWMYWHLRSIDRAVGLPDTKVSVAYLKDCLGYVREVVRSQISFHRAAAKRSEQIEHRLHRLGLFLFAATCGLIAWHLFEYWHPPHARLTTEAVHHWDFLTFFGAFLPAVGAALAAINNQGEFARIAKRSHAMAERLEQMNKDLEQLLMPDATVRSSEAASQALRVAQIMVDEVLDWRVVFLDRPLVTPA